MRIELIACKLIGWIWGLIVCGLITLLVGCSAKRVVASSALHDTVWSVSVVREGSADSVVVRERVEIVPKLIRVGDTVLLHRDTTIVRVVERNTVNNRNYYTDKGSVVRDTVRQVVVPAAQKKSRSLWWVWMAVGLTAGAGAAVLLKRAL